MSLADKKFLSVLQNFGTLTTSATELNKASAELASAVSQLDESLKRLNLGITGWVVIRSRGAEPPDYDDYELGYAKVDSKWGLAIRRIYGDDEHEDVEGPWCFSEAKRDLRIASVDKIPELLEKLAKKTTETAEQLTEKTSEVRKYGSAIEAVAAEKTRLKTAPVLPYSPKVMDPTPPYVPPPLYPPPGSASSKAKQGGK